MDLQDEHTDVCQLTEEEATSICAVLVVQVVLDRKLAMWLLFRNYLENTNESIPLGLCILHDKSPKTTMIMMIMMMTTTMVIMML